MYNKRMNPLGRTVIPKETLKIFQLKEGGSVNIMHNEREIIIEPHKQRYVCAVIGKLTSEVVRIREA